VMPPSGAAVISQLLDSDVNVRCELAAAQITLID
jgi:hypothetical protein